MLFAGQMIGQDGAAKRLDVLAAAICKQMTEFKLAELDLSCSPLYAAVWDSLLIAASRAAG